MKQTEAEEEQTEESGNCVEAAVDVERAAINLGHLNRKPPRQEGQRCSGWWRLSFATVSAPLLLLLLTPLLFLPRPVVLPSPWNSALLPPQQLDCPPPPPPPSIALPPLSTPSRAHSGEEESGAENVARRPWPSRIPTRRPLICTKPARTARPTDAKTATAMKMNPVECS